MVTLEKSFTERIHGLEVKIGKLEAEVKTYSDLRNRVVELVVAGAIGGLLIVTLKFAGLIT